MPILVLYVSFGPGGERLWICTMYGDYFSYNDWVSYCSCGAKEFREKCLSCHHPSHQKLLAKINLIQTQLKKLVIREDCDPTIQEAINVLSTSTDKNVITETRIGIRESVDGDSQVLIDEITNHVQS